MTSSITREFIEAIPKTDLHLHLDGSLRLSTLLELAAEQGVELPSDTEEGLNREVFKPQYENLGEYLRGFACTCSVMRTAPALERIARELAEDVIAEGIRYIEVRFAPQLHVNEQLTTADALRAVARGLEAARNTHNHSTAVAGGEDLPFHFGIIACAMRSFNEHMGQYYQPLLQVMSHAPKREVFATASLELARVLTELLEQEPLPIVGFDLAGEEAGYPAIYHKAAFQFVHSHFIRKTVHAGEAYGPESIFQALTECHANRIGHGTFMFAKDRITDPDITDPARYVTQLVEYIANQRITVEVCPTSNLQTLPAIRSIAEHPVRHMIEHDLSVSICTDNRLVSHTTVADELDLLVRELPISRKQFRNIIIAGFKGSFYPGPYSEKRAFVRQVIDCYEALETALLD